MVDSGICVVWDGFVEDEDEDGMDDHGWSTQPMQALYLWNACVQCGGMLEILDVGSADPGG